MSPSVQMNSANRPAAPRFLANAFQAKCSGFSQTADQLVELRKLYASRPGKLGHVVLELPLCGPARHDVEDIGRAPHQAALPRPSSRAASKASSSARDQRVVFGPSFTGCGNRPRATQRQMVCRDTPRCEATSLSLRYSLLIWSGIAAPSIVEVRPLEPHRLQKFPASGGLVCPM